MEEQAFTPAGGPPQKRMRAANGGAKRKQPQFSADIVFTSKGGNIQTVPSLGKLLKGVTEPIIGLQFIWEYRSPSKCVPPHYQCKLCQVTRLQNDMLAHVRGWKHGFRYMKRNHPDRVPYEEEDAVKDPALRKGVKDIAAEVEKTEGRGQLRVILKEPRTVPAFHGLRSTVPKLPPVGAPGGPGGPPMRLRQPKHGGRFPGEFPPQGGLLSDYPMGGHGDMGGYNDPPLHSGPPFSGGDMGPPRRFPDDGGLRLGGGGGGGGGGGDFGMPGRREPFGMGGLLGEAPGRRYSDDFRGGPTGGGPVDRPGLMGAAPEGSNLPSTLLKYLDSFRIENENDAQIVLKVTQKLTDVLMEYRLRSVSSGPPGPKNSSSMSSMGYSSPPARMPSGGDRYSSSFSGPSRYSDGPSRFYN